MTVGLVAWVYSPSYSEVQELTALQNEFQANLSNLVKHCLKSGA